MPSRPPIPDSLPSPRDPRLDDFLVRAAPIVAAERGLTTIARAKLQLIATELQLSDELLTTAFQQLQLSVEPAAPPRVVDWRLEQFGDYLRDKLKKLPLPKLAPDQEDRLVSIAAKRFDLPEHVARMRVGEVAFELKIQRRDRSEVAESLGAMVTSCLNMHHRVTDDDWKQFHETGHQWGLRAEQVRQIVDEQAAAWRTRRSRIQRQRNALILGGTAAVFVVLVALAITMSSRARQRYLAATESAAARMSDDSPIILDAPSAVGSPPAWWDVDLAVAVSGRKQVSAEFAKLIDPLSSPEAGERVGAYERLAAQAFASTTTAVPANAWRDLFNGCAALEPDDTASQRIFSQLLSPVRALRHGSIEREGELRRAYWALETALLTFGRKGIQDARKKSLAAVLEETLGVLIGAQSPLAQQRETALAALTADGYRRLVELAAKQPARAVELEAVLFSLGGSSLTEPERERWETQLLLALIAAAPGEWESYRGLMERALAVSDPVQVLKLIDVYETTQSSRLQAALEAGLAKRTKVAVASESPAELARAMRLALGVRATTTVAVDRNARWKTLQAHAKSLSDFEAKQAKSLAKLDHTLQCARAATFALALAQRDITSEQLDALGKSDLLLAGVPLVSERVTGLSAKSAAEKLGMDSEPTREIGNRAFLQQIGTLRNHDRSTPPQRLAAFRQVAAATRIDDLSMSSADAIAQYLYSVKPAQEFQMIAPSFPAIIRWRTVRIALADRLPQSELRADERAQLLSAVLGRTIPAADVQGDGWPARRALLQSAADSIRSGAPVDEDAKLAAALDQLEASLLETYVERLRLIGGDTNLGDSPACGDALFRFGALLAARLERQTLADADRAWLNTWPDQTVVVEYLAKSDLQRSVLLQQQVARLLAIEVAVQFPTRADAVRAIADRLARVASPGLELLDQLRIGEAEILRIAVQLHAD